MNPGGSIKDRAAHYVVLDAEERGLLRPGGTVVEGTAGNTGIGLAHVGRSKGYKLVIYMPDTQSQGKIDLLRLLGAEVYPVPAVAFDNPQNYNHQAKRHAERLDNAVWTNQFDNTANRLAHIRTTAPEIWAQAGGKVDGFTCAVGTGGTLAGVGMGLKALNEDIVIGLTDPHGAALYEYFAHGELRAEGGSVAEGIGQSRITANLDGAPVDTQFRISDEEGLEQVYGLLENEGLCVGLSSGINVAGAIALARQMGPGHRIVTLLCDSGMRYLSSLFNPEWLAAKGLTIPAYLRR